MIPAAKQCAWSHGAGWAAIGDDKSFNIQQVHTEMGGGDEDGGPWIVTKTSEIYNGAAFDSAQTAAEFHRDIWNIKEQPRAGAWDG